MAHEHRIDAWHLGEVPRLALEGGRVWRIIEAAVDDGDDEIGPLRAEVRDERRGDLLHPLGEDLAIEPLLVPVQDLRRREPEETDLDRALDGGAAGRLCLDGLREDDRGREE